MTGSVRIELFAQRLIRHSRLWLAAFMALTLLLGWSATGLRTDAAFSKMIPLDHPFMKVFTEHEATFGGANRILVAIAPKSGDIYTEQSLSLLRKVTEEVFYIQGVERSSVTSLFTPNVRFTEVVEEGFRGGNIVSADFQGRPEQIEQVRSNVAKSDWVGRIVSREVRHSSQQACRSATRRRESDCLLRRSRRRSRRSAPATRGQRTRSTSLVLPRRLETLQRALQAF